jgi:hypothetical protein
MIKRDFQDKGEIDLYIELPKLITSILYEANYTFLYDDDAIELIENKIINITTTTVRNCIASINEGNAQDHAITSKFVEDMGKKK